MRTIAFILVATLAACGDPLADFGRLTDQDVPTEETTVAALPDANAPEGGGFLGRILNAGRNPKPAPEETLPEAAPGAAEVQEAPAQEETSQVESAAAAPTRRGGLLGLFRPSAQEAPLQNAAVPAALGAPTSGIPSVAFGTELPFGEIARVCDAKTRKLGKKVETLPARGLKIYDSAPGTIDKRTYYVTGFADGCPRQFTAANVIAAAPSRYEAFRFGPAGQHMPQGATDKAYDKIKRRVCGVGKRKPCGAKINALDRSTTFLSAYEFFDGNAQWVKILIHDGEIVETALKKP